MIRKSAKLIATVAEATVPLENSHAWPEIVARLQAAGVSAKAAHRMRGRVWLARRVRKAPIPVQ